MTFAAALLLARGGRARKGWRSARQSDGPSRRCLRMCCHLTTKAEGATPEGVMTVMTMVTMTMMMMMIMMSK
jgi:hypothetical protein